MCAEVVFDLFLNVPGAGRGANKMIPGIVSTALNINHAKKKRLALLLISAALFLFSFHLRRLPFDRVVVLERLPADLPGGSKLRDHRPPSPIPSCDCSGHGEPGLLSTASLRNPAL